MQYREIIIKSWDLTKKHPFLNWLAGIPLALKFIIASVYLPLRIGLWFIPNIFEKAYNLVMKSYRMYETQTIGVIIFFGIVVILFLIVPAFCDGALIGTIGKIIHSGEGKVKKQFSIAYGFNVYLPLVELRAMTSLLNPVFVYIGMSTLGHFNKPFFDLLLIPAIILFIIDVVVNFSLIYSNYELVINNSGVLESMKKSMKLVLFNITETFFILMLLILIFVRAILNLLIVFIIPFLIYLLATYLASYVSQVILYILIVLGALTLYYYALKTASMLSVFASTVLVYTFNELSENEEDVIVKDKSPNPQTQNNTIQENAKVIPQDALEIIGKSLLREMEKISKNNHMIEGKGEDVSEVHKQLSAPEIIADIGYVSSTTTIQDPEISQVEVEENIEMYNKAEIDFEDDMNNDKQIDNLSNPQQQEQKYDESENGNNLNDNQL